MVSQLHEALLLPFQSRPALLPRLLGEPSCLELPMFDEASSMGADLNDIQPTEYRADMVIALNDKAGKPVMGIVLEVQLSENERKKYAWPAYVANLRARLECPVCLLVLAGDDSVARWAAEPIEIGPGFTFTPFVIGPAEMPQITSAEEARANPEMAVLSALMHGRDDDVDTSVRIALAARHAIATLDEDRSRLYYDLVTNALSDSAREALNTMRPAGYEYQSEFARKYFGEGKEKGKAEGRTEGEQSGRASLVLKLLNLRFGVLASDAQRAVAAAPSSVLDEIAERVLTAHTLEDALSPLSTSA